MKYIETVQLKKADFDRINALLGIDSFSNMTEEQKALHPTIEDFIPVYSVTFADGFAVTCSVLSGGNNYFDKVTVYTHGDSTGEDFDACGYIPMKDTFGCNGNKHIVKIEVI